MWEIVVHLAVAGGVCDGVFLCCLFFQRDVLDEILDLSQFLRVFLPTLSNLSVMTSSWFWRFNSIVKVAPVRTQ